MSSNQGASVASPARDRLSTLPTHVFNLIIAQLPRRDLCSLARTSKRNCGRTRPEIYNAIHLKWHKSVQLPVHQLLNTVLNRPHVASLVKHVYVSGTYRMRWPDWLIMRFPRMGWLKAHVRRVRLPDIDLWDRAVEYRATDMPIALFLSTLHRLESLYLAFEFHSKLITSVTKHAVFQMRQNRSQQHHIFSELKYFRLMGPNDIVTSCHKSVDPNLLAYLFYLPQLRIIQMCLPWYPRGILWPFEDYIVAEELMALDLRDIEVQPHVLLQLLRKTPNLQRLRYDMWIIQDSRINRHGPRYSCDVSVLYNALFQVRRSLRQMALAILYKPEYLDLLRMTSQDGFNFNFFDRCDLFGSLKHFQKLESLTIPWGLLLGTTYKPPSVRTNLEVGLPRSLQFLKIREDIVHMREIANWPVDICMGRLQNFILNWYRIAPRLLDFNVVVPNGSIKGWKVIDKAYLQDLCYRMGVPKYDINIRPHRKEDFADWY